MWISFIGSYRSLSANDKSDFQWLMLLQGVEAQTVRNLLKQAIDLGVETHSSTSQIK